MPLRYLFGPVTSAFAEEYLVEPRRAGWCLTFDVSGQPDVLLAPEDSWESIVGRLPAGWQPDLVVLYLPYRLIPESLWSAPVPVVGLAGDWNWQWHAYRLLLRRCERVLTDVAGVAALAQEGMGHARAANLYGGGQGLASWPWAEGPRDIDLLFVGNFHPAVQRERLSWLGRLAALGERWRVVLAGGVFGADYYRLLNRARIVFNRSIRGECNHRVAEAVAAGALLFQEAGNREVPGLLRDRQECVYYDDGNLEELLQYYLEHEEERQAMAQAGRACLRRCRFAELWAEQLGLLEQDWAELVERRRQRAVLSPLEHLLGRSWQVVASSVGGDPTLVRDLTAALADQPRCAVLHNALGLARWGAAGPEARSGVVLAAVAQSFQNAWTSDPRQLVAGLNLAEVLVLLGQKEHALEQAQRTLAQLEQQPELTAVAAEGGPFSLGFDHLRVAWERAAWANAGRREAETAAKRNLLRWRLHTLLAELSDDVVHYYEAQRCWPDLAAAAGALGCALARHGRPAEAAGHLDAALASNPFDREAARALYHVLGQLGRVAGQQELARARRMLHRAGGELVPVEGWFAEERPPAQVGGDQIVPPLRIVWQGAQAALHSLALVNRAVCRRLLARGHELCLRLPATADPAAVAVPLEEGLRAHCERPLAQPAEVHVGHQWPPDFTPPAAGHWVIMQPWEFGSLPRRWLGPLRDAVDEVWVPSSFVRNCFVQSGVPGERVRVIPLGVEPHFFEEPARPYPLATRKSFRFLFVGGTIARKGIDVLLKAYLQAFSAQDDVCLVIKDMGAGTFYQGQTAHERIAQAEAQPQAPAIEYLAKELTAGELTNLYASCDCLVHPYRGEGFGLPIAEAMACGLPVIVTGYGAALDYCSHDNAWLLPARVVRFADQRVDDLETVERPWWAEPDGDALRYYLRYAVEHREEGRRKGQVGREYSRRHLTWEHTVAAVEARLLALREMPIRRLGKPSRGVAVASAISVARPRVSLCMIVKNEEANLPACLDTVADLVDEIIVVDTGSTDATAEVARRRGAKVFDFAWVDSFAAARNESLRQATGEWIFWLDADDRLDEANRAKLRALLAELPSANVAFVMKCLCLPDPQVGTATEVDHVRLFRWQADLRWQFRIHEQILPSIRRVGGSVRWSAVVIHHVGYQDASVRARKLQRDLRLLNLENADQPDNPFTLFNLGAIYLEQGQPAVALPLLQRSLERSHPGDSIARKLYAQIAHCQRLLQQTEQALATCQAGRLHYADDAEILFQESLVHQDGGRLDAAVACLQQVLASRPGEHFASVDAGLRGHKARNNLAVLYRKLGRLAEAEREWRLAVAEQAHFLPAWLGLGEVMLAQERWAELEEVMERLGQLPQGTLEAGVLRGRAHLARKEFAAAQVVLREVSGRFPQAVRPRVILSHVLLQEGRDWGAAEQALLAILALEPGHAEARRNLEILRRQHPPRL